MGRSHVQPGRDTTEAEKFVIECAQRAHREHWRATSDPSAGTKRATDVCRKWQQAVEQGKPGVAGIRFESEFNVADDARQAIDVVDKVERVAYELKASSNNPHHEFYKDVFKVLVHNRKPMDLGPIGRLVFLVPWAGANRLRGPFVDAAIEMAGSAGVSTHVEVLDPEVEAISRQLAESAPERAVAADRVLTWIVADSRFRLEYRKASKTDSLRVFVDRTDGFALFKLDAAGRVEILFDTLKNQPASNLGCSMERFRDLLNQIPGIEIPLGSLQTWKTFSVEALGTSRDRKAFSNAIDELIG